MKRFRWLAFLIALITAFVCIVLLLNFTAPNPTGRRYSSAPVQTRGSAQTIGASGEQILARDLHTPDNDDPDQLQCFCNDLMAKLSSSQCRVCLVSDASIGNYRRPDFVGANFIAESKNRQNLLYSYDDQVDQITDYVTGAKLLGRPLWLYVRVNTLLSPEFYPLVASTGGGVIPYFTTPGYVDPIDQLARTELIMALIIAAIMGIWELGARHLALPTQPKDSPPQAKHKTDAAEGFVKSAKDRAQRKIDIEDARHNELD